MTITEKAAYLKGLMEGMKLDTTTNEGKILAAVVELLGDVTRKLSDVEETTIAISDELDEIEDDLDAIEDYIIDDDEDDEDEDDYDDEDEDEDDEEDDEDDYVEFGPDEETIYEVKCPCGNVIDFDEATLDKGSIVCPACGETLEFATEDEDDQE